VGNFNRKKHKDKQGVNDLIGNILILGITVTLFTGIMMYVVSMPQPNGDSFADFTNAIQLNPSSSKSTINITHMGGQPLTDQNTIIYISVDGARTSYYLHNSTPSITTLATGMTWSLKLNKDLSHNTVSAMIVNTETNKLMYTATIWSGDSGSNQSPIIGARGIQPSPTYDGDFFWFYATVTDPDKNLDKNAVYLDASTLNVAWSGLKMIDTNADNIFTVACPTPADVNWKGKTVIISATDLDGKSTTGGLTVSIRAAQDNNGGGGGGAGWPPGNIDYSGLQGFNIFLKNEWDVKKYNATPKVTFDHGQVAVVVVVSKFAVNTQTTNSLLVMNQTTKQIQSAVSSPGNVFKSFEYISGYYVYTCEIDTGLLPQLTSYYYLDATLKDSWVPNNVFQMNTRILVNSTPGVSIVGYPTFVTYKTSSFTTPSNNFTTYDPASNIMYVEIITKTGGTWINNAGVVELRDFFWNSELRSSPYVPTGTYPPYVNNDIRGWVGGVSNVWQAGAAKYRFAINLNDVYGTTPWIAGKNAYILKYDMFQAGIETYVLSKVVNIASPTTKLDIVTGGDPVKNARFSYQGSLYFYSNDNTWSPPSVLVSTNDKQTYNPVIWAVKAGDLNGDAKSDFVAIMQDTSKNNLPVTLNAYIQKSDGNFEKYLIATLTHTVDASNVARLGLGNTGLGNTQDVCVGFADGVVELYKNTGAWTKYVIDTSSNRAVTALQVANMAAPGTIHADLNRSMDIIIGRSDGTMTVYRNQNGAGTSWTSINLSPTATTNTQDFATGEDSTQFIQSGTYLDTTSPSQLPYRYEALKERPIYRQQNTHPSAKGPIDNCTDALIQLTPGGNDPYTVLGLKNASMIEWDNTNLIDDLPTVNVMFEVRYKTNGANNGLDWMTWKDGGAPQNMIRIMDTNGAWTTATYNLTTNFSYASSLRNLNVTYRNTNPSSTSVDFMYWSVNVTWVTGDELYHNYTISVPTTGSAYTFSLYALRQLGNDGDAIRVNYSTDGGASYKAFSTPLVITDIGAFGYYTRTIPAAEVRAANGIIKIKVVASAVKSSDPGYPQVWIGQMMIAGSGVAATSVGTSIMDVAVDDMNGDGWNDIVAFGYTSTVGKIMVFQNTAGYTIFQSANAIPITAIQSGIIGIGTGKIFNPYAKTYKDIAYYSQTTVYFINQTSLGTYAKVAGFTIVPGYNMVKMMVADVDGNGRADILIGGTDRIDYYSNYLGYAGMTIGTRIAWKLIVVDNSLVGSAGFITMDCRKFQAF